jgi:hypothetical protein
MRSSAAAHAHAELCVAKGNVNCYGLILQNTEVEEAAEDILTLITTIASCNMSAIYHNDRTTALACLRNQHHHGTNADAVG